MKVPEIKTRMANYNNTIKTIAASIQKQEVTLPVHNKIVRSAELIPNADIIEEMLKVFAKGRQDEISNQNKKFLAGVIDPISKLNFNV